MTTPAAIDAFLHASGYGTALRVWLAGDASARRYLRLTHPDRSAILMVAPVTTPDQRASFAAFRQVGTFLRANGIAAPEVFAVQAEAGLLLMEDFGDLSLARLLDAGRAAPAYRQALDVLFVLARADIPDWVARPTTQSQAAMVDLTFSLLPDAGTLHTATVQGLADLLAQHASGPPALALRDFHADNLIWRPHGAGLSTIGVLDFQDAVALPTGYDLASLVDDPRRDVPPGLRSDLIAAFADGMGITPAAAQARIDTLSLLRNLRILGIFHRLASTGKPAYRDFLPHTRHLVARALDNPALAPLRQPVHETLRRAAHWADGAPA